MKAQAEKEQQVREHEFQLEKLWLSQEAEIRLAQLHFETRLREQGSETAVNQTIVLPQIKQRTSILKPAILSNANQEVQSDRESYARVTARGRSVGFGENMDLETDHLQDK